MRGKCSFSDCAFTEEDDVDVTKCSSCSKKVHHICSNAIYEGDLSVRVCSHNCVIALGLPTQSRTLWTSSAASTSDNQLTGGARAHGKTPRKSSKGKKKTSAPNSNKKESKQAKKFHSTTGDDLALLREILSVQPYAAKHGSVTARYQDVADNFNEHLGEELSLRTIKERFFLLLKDFKTTDNQYRRKSGVAEEYTEHKQLLQDITDAMRDLQDEKTKKKKAVQDKSDRLESAGERLRHQAINRRCQRAQTMQDERSDCEESADESSLDEEESVNRSSTDSTKSGGGVTTAQVNAATVNFIERQRKRHKDEHELQQELAFKRVKAENEEQRWKKEFDFRKAEADRSDKKWSEEVALRRADMELRKEELALLKLQLDAQKTSGDIITQTLV
ncbi:hypothetical protein GN244_ATG12959 [Phytophthora infestans]|uniref:Uncharacterized protein n=1 Tax=Phytophthora infestans TaxID=4787 RepID=A0A833SZ55_PHYIN|nr:hypothetical protein GN244_ATG12959 [Phytophthora infestans]